MREYRRIRDVREYSGTGRQHPVHRLLLRRHRQAHPDRELLRQGQGQVLPVRTRHPGTRHRRQDLHRLGLRLQRRQRRSQPERGRDRQLGRLRHVQGQPEAGRQHPVHRLLLRRHRQAHPDRELLRQGQGQVLPVRTRHPGTRHRRQDLHRLGLRLQRRQRSGRPERGRDRQLGRLPDVQERSDRG